MKAIRPGPLLALALALTLALAACGKADEAYPPAYELNFMRACEAQGAGRSVCACTWAKIQAEAPHQDLAALERLPPAARAEHALQRQIEGYAAACVAENPAP